MTTGVLSTGIRRDSSLRLGAAVGSALTVAVIVVTVFLTPSGPTTSPSGSQDEAAARRAALVSWEQALHPLVLSGGEVVALGPRAGVGQIQRREFPARTQQVMARGWVGSLSRLEKEMAALPTPDFLLPARALLLEAMRGYVAASRTLLTATTATGAERDQLLSAAAAAGQAADQAYDRATAAIALWRSQLALPVDWSG